MFSVTYQKIGETPGLWSVLAPGVGGRRKIASPRQHDIVCMAQPAPLGTGCALLYNNMQSFDTFRAILCLIQN